MTVPGLSIFSVVLLVLIQNPDAIGRIVDDLRRAVKLAAPWVKQSPCKIGEGAAAAATAFQHRRLLRV